MATTLKFEHVFYFLLIVSKLSNGIDFMCIQS
jgi:hypothetical protein